MLRIGIVGTGSIAEAHAAAYRANSRCALVAACSRDEQRRAAFARRHGLSATFPDARSLYASGEVDAVSICSWNCYHKEAAVQALERGIHVLCEKPPALNAGEVEHMIRAAQQAGRILMFGFTRRFTERARLAREVVAGGQLGRICYAKAAYLRRAGNPGGWFTERSKSGGGALIDIGIHLLDLFVYLRGGGHASRVSGRIFRLPGEGYGYVEQVAAAAIYFQDGSLLHLEASWVQHIKEDMQLLTVYGEQGTLSVYPALEICQSGPGGPSVRALGLDPGLDTKEQRFKAQIDNFLQTILGSARCESPAENGLAIMRIVDAAYLSAQTGAEVRLG